MIYFSDIKFFELTLFGRHEVKLHHPMFLSPEILSVHVGFIWVTKLDVSGLKNIGRCKFSSCQPKRVNLKGGQQSLVLYVNLPVTQPPVDGLMPDFAWWEQM